MAQQIRRSGVSGEQAWLAMLILTFETVSRQPAAVVDPISLAALKAQLARPAAFHSLASFVRH